MSSKPPVTLLIFGARGDLTHRLLLPGLASLVKVETERDVRVVGADRNPKTAAEWKALVKDSFSMVQAPAKVTNKVLKSTRYVQADLLDPQLLADLVASCEGPIVMYFALPPAVSMKICALLEHIELPEGTRLALEKPFGTDEASARAFNDQLHRVVPEDQIFRVDHFNGVSTVLNLIGLRFANRIMQPLWSAEHIERVEILYDEALALEGRAGYYDSAGALRDMLQSHLLEVLAMFAMEPIATINSAELQDLKAQVLRATHLWGNSPKRSSRRARYTAGTMDAGTKTARKIPSYVDEDGVDATRNTETLAQLKVEISNNRWAGVPFTLRSGKALGVARKQIVCYFRDVPHLPTGFTNTNQPDKLIIDLKPGAVSLVLSMNAEGDPLDLEQKQLTATLAEGRMQAYGEVLRDLLDGNQLLSVRGDIAELCWHIVDPVLAAWAADKVPLEEYPAGSEGPENWLPQTSVIETSRSHTAS